MALFEYVIALASLISRMADYSKLSSDSSPEEQILEIQKSFHHAAKFPSDKELGVFKTKNIPKFPGISEEDWNEWNPFYKDEGTDEGTEFNEESEFDEDSGFDEDVGYDESDETDEDEVPSNEEAIGRAHKGLYGNAKGDMLLPPSYGPSKGVAIKRTVSLWPNAQVPYEIAPDIRNNEIMMKLISKAIEIYHNNTCIRFVPYEKYPRFNHIRIKKGMGCSSYVGMVGGTQAINFGKGCEYVGTILHEFGHALGLYHEQQRSDRDKYIIVFLENVIKGAESQFRKLSPDEEPIITPYGVDSVMQYGNYAFSKKPGTLKTMITKNGRKLLEPYEKPRLDSSDVLVLNELYKCKKKH